MKNKHKKSVFARVMYYFKPLRWRIAVVIFLGIVGIAMYSYMPNLTADALNTFEEWSQPLHLHYL